MPASRLSLRLIFSAAAVFILLSFARADTIYLKNGRRVEGMIKNQNAENVELDVGSGSVVFSRKEIDKISLSSEQEALVLRKKWEAEMAKAKEVSLAAKESFIERQQTELDQEKDSIFVNAILNRDVSVRLLLDTGASVIVLSKQTADRLGITRGQGEIRSELQFADGRKVPVLHVVLKSVNIHEIEAKNVDAVVMLTDSPIAGLRDGILGMSFLKRFNFKVDQKNKKLILERLE